MKRKKPVLYATLTVGLVCLLVYVVQLVNGYADNTEGMILFGAYYKPFILAGEYWRLLTVGFVHANIWHLMINLMSLYALGSALEMSMGRWKYLTVLLGSVLGGSLFLFAGQGNTIAVGLSAGLYGLMSAYVILIVRAGGMKVPRVRNALLSTIMINLLINFMPGVSWIAHLGGAVSGALLCGALCLDGTEVQKRMNYGAAAIVLAFSLGFLSYRNAYSPSDQIYILSDYHILTAEKKYLPMSYINSMAQKLDDIYGSSSILEDAVQQKEA